MRNPFPLSLALVFLLLTPSVLAIEIPDLTIIPDKISVNSSFVVGADPHATGSESVRVTWVVPGLEGAFGLFPKEGDMWICYFSNHDPDSTCGPTPFLQPSFGTPYTMLVDAVNQYGISKNRSVEVDVGGIVITSNIDIIADSVEMTAWADAPVEPGGIFFKTYRADDLTQVQGKSGSLQYFSPVRGYVGNMTLPEGEYYIAFTAQSATDFGGGITKVSIGGSGPGSSQELDAEDIVWSPVITAGQHYEVTRFKITNIGSATLTNLSAEVATEMDDYVSIELANTTLAPNSSMYFTVAIDDIEESMSIETYVDFYTGETFLARTTATITVTVSGGIGTYCEGKTNGTYCNGGVCCSGSCIQDAECCTDTDCRAGESCTSNQCISGQTTTCLKGSCYTGSSCPAGKSYTGESCKISGEDGVCCETPTIDECAGKSDGTSCSGGVCCSESCEECCTDTDCPLGEECSNNICVSLSNGDCFSGFCYPGYTECPEGTEYTDEDCKEGGEAGICCISTVNGPEPSGFDFNTIIIILVLVIAALGGFLAFKKIKAKKAGGEEGEEELPEEFSDEDFY